MMNTSFDHLAIRGLILLVNSITPLCIASTIYYLTWLVSGIPHNLSKITAIYILAETYFYLLHHLRQKRAVNHAPSPPPSTEARKRFWKEAMKTLDDEGRIALEGWLCGWFVRVRAIKTWSGDWWRFQAEEYGLIPMAMEEKIGMDEIKRGNVEEFLAGGLPL
jgi:hypothetical protein